ncbi:pyruvate decarboxylase [Rhizoctonia solani AG-1 IA]|uniref:Pyruvate decarboxylase n=1 Tax=Thanatephorus cucumeris (strain AG1-IA) TaxID=983506 RepID=L8X795_THACA|nr:pyruvate decarboxylase [Rhizoctonia solani AG-1 IA]
MRDTDAELRPRIFQLYSVALSPDEVVSDMTQAWDTIDNRSRDRLAEARSIKEHMSRYGGYSRLHGKRRLQRNVVYRSERWRDIRSIICNFRMTNYPESISMSLYLIERLKQLGVKHIFGVPGDFNLEFLDYIEDDDTLQWVGNANELNAAYAADGYARIKRSLSCIVTTYGVGELSALNGIAGRVPVLHIVGVPSEALQQKHALLHHTLGDGVFSHFSKMSGPISAAVAKLHTSPTGTDGLPYEVDRVLSVALTQCRPVYLTFPTNLHHVKVPSKNLLTPLPHPHSAPLTPAALLEEHVTDPQAEKELELVVGEIQRLFEASHDPVVLVDACAERFGVEGEVEKLVTATGVKFFTTPMAKGVLDESHESFGGVYVGANSLPAVRELVEKSDLVLAVGALKSDFNSGSFSWGVEVKVGHCVELHSTHTQIGYAHYPTVTFRTLLPALNEKLAESIAKHGPKTGTTRKQENLKLAEEQQAQAAEGPIKEVETEDAQRFGKGAITQAYLWARMGKWYRENDIIVSETGTSNFGIIDVPVPKNTSVVSQVLWGSIGYSVGAALGCALAAKEQGDRRVILFVGDGSLQLTLQEIGTMIRHELNPYIFVLNNDGYEIERCIHGPTRGYNNIQPYNHQLLLQALSNPDGSQPTKSYKVKSQTELNALLEDETFNKRETIQLIELIMPRDDVPRALKTQAQLPFKMSETSDDHINGNDSELASIAVYRAHLPYETETPEEMTKLLESIVAKIVICIRAKEWEMLGNWNHRFYDRWMSLKYPMPREVRVRLAKLFYTGFMPAHVVLPGIEPSRYQEWADILGQLIYVKAGHKLRLELDELQLDWLPLWRRCQREIWPSQRAMDSSRNVMNILLYVAEVSRFYYPPSEIPRMLDEFIPLVTQDVGSMLIWEAFNSTVVDDRLIHVMGNLAEEHCAGKDGRWGEGSTERRDIGIFTDSTSSHADKSTRQPTKVKKSDSRTQSLAVLLVYSMAHDGPVRVQDSAIGFVAGSRALDSLDKLITSVESFFHPSNAGQWTLIVSPRLNYRRITYEFNRRWYEETSSKCKIPEKWRLNLQIRRAFVSILKTPALLAIFSKDQIASSFAQGSLKSMIMLEPQLLMPDILERAYSGLESVNETHRTTVVMNSLTGIALPLASSNHWLGGQKHIVPLLELAIPGIDLNDPGKTVCAPPVPETPGAIGDTDPDIPVGPFTTMGPEEEDSLTRQSTGAFSGQITSFFRRVFHLLENLPEEGSNKKTGGKSEEQVLKALRSALDVVTYHLSDPMFDLVLKLVFDYASTNARANSIRAFGYVVACLSRARPKDTLAKFLPHCVHQVEVELAAGASSVRTTAAHAVISSDTTLLWNMGILRGILGYGGQEWQDPDMNQTHNRKWGTVMEAKDAVLDWHVPSSEEIDFAIEILDQVVDPSIEIFNGAIDAPDSQRDGVWRNDLYIKTQAFACDTIYMERPGNDEDVETEELIPQAMAIKSGFVLQDPADDRYQRVLAHRARFGQLLHHAAAALKSTDTEDHIDLVMSVLRGIDTFLLDYGVTRDTYAGVAKQYEVAKQLTRLHAKQKAFPRLVWIKRAQSYHALRCHFASMYQRRSELDDQIINDLFDFSISAYTRIRRQAQAVLHTIVGYYVRSTRMVVTRAFEELNKQVKLEKSSDPDRMKGALHVIWNKAIVGWVVSRKCHTNHNHLWIINRDEKGSDYRGPFLLSVMACQSQDKVGRIRKELRAILTLVPSFRSRRLGFFAYISRASITKIHRKTIGSLINEVVPKLAPELFETYSLTHDDSSLDGILKDLESVGFSPADEQLLNRVMTKRSSRISKYDADYSTMTKEIAQVCLKPRTHWRYLQFGLRVLSATLRKDRVPEDIVVQAFANNSTSDFSTLRWYAQRHDFRAIVKLMKHIKLRTYSPNDVYGPLVNPLHRHIDVQDGPALLDSLNSTCSYEDQSAIFVDWIENTGFLAWTPSVKAYVVPPDNSTLSWDPASTNALHIIEEVINTRAFWEKLAQLYSQESARGNSSIELRDDNIDFIKSLFKTLQRLGATFSLKEIMCGAMRGSKHWPRDAHLQLWSWVGERLQQIFDRVKPDTLRIWEGMLTTQIAKRDPRRHPHLIDFIKNLPVDFDNESAFYGKCSRGTPIAQNIHCIKQAQWHPVFSSVSLFLDACRDQIDPLQIRQTAHMDKIEALITQFPQWRAERLPPPKVNQSQYDKCGLTVLQWIWSAGHAADAPSIFPYVMPLLPEMFQVGTS